MKSWIVASTGLALMAATGVALAQSPAPPPPPPPAQDGAPMPPGGPMGERHGRMEGRMGGPMGWHHGPMGGPMAGPMGGMMGMHMRPPPSKAAHFRFHKGDATVDIKCADDEPMKACVDAASALMDKLPAAPK